MEQHDSSGFIPDAYDRPGRQAKATMMSPLRNRWRIPAVATGVAVVAALCLHTGSTAHAASAAAKPASGLVVHPAVDSGANTSLKGHVEAAADTATGGVHGAFDLYEGAGGGIEFWFNPATGDLTVAVGIGTGANGGGVLGTYAPGSVPEAGTYGYADVDLSAGTVASVNLLGTYSYTNGVFVGTVSLTVEGRTLTISSDGSSSFKVNVYPAAGAVSFTGAEGVNYTYLFNITDVVDYIWDPIVEGEISSPYTLDDSDAADDTTVYNDGSDLTTTDGSSSDASSDDASDSTDGGDGGGGDGGDGGGCSFNSTIRHDDQTSSAKGSTTVTPDEDYDDGPVDVC